MKLTGWALFVSKIEIVLCMIFGVHALKTGKHKKLAALWLGFEILTQVVTTAFSWIMLRVEEGSWSKGFKKFGDSLDKEFGIVDDSEWVRRDIYEDVEEQRKDYKEKVYEIIGKVSRRDNLIQKYVGRNKALREEYAKID